MLPVLPMSAFVRFINCTKCVMLNHRSAMPSIWALRFGIQYRGNENQRGNWRPMLRCRIKCSPSNLNWQLRELERLDTQRTARTAGQTLQDSRAPQHVIPGFDVLRNLFSLFPFGLQIFVEGGEVQSVKRPVCQTVLAVVEDKRLSKSLYIQPSFMFCRGQSMFHCVATFCRDKKLFALSDSIRGRACPYPNTGN